MELDRNRGNSHKGFASQAMRIRFISEYLVDLNGTQAAMRAGYSPKCAAAKATEMLKDPEIFKAINKQIESRQKRTLITADRVLAELYEIAMADISDAFDEDNNLKPMNQIPESLRRAICGIEVFEEFAGFGEEREKIGETKKIKFWDKGKALEALAKHLKLLVDRHEVEFKVPEDLVDRMNEGRSRLDEILRSRNLN